MKTGLLVALNNTFTCHSTGNKLEIDTEKRRIRLEIEVDEEICTMYEYFDIFLGRMLMCRAAAEMLDCKFSLVVNGSKVL